MRSIPGWKTVMKYVTGMLVLAVSIALALFLPEWYAKWQDEKIAGQVTLAHREQITFLDTESLDLAGKMKVLTETSVLSWTSALWEYEPEWYPEEDQQILEQYFGMKPDEMIRKFHSLMLKWCDAKLLPGDCERLVNTEYLGHLAAHIVNADEAMLTLVLAAFSDGVDTVILITDQDVEMIYYGCTLGTRTMEFMAQEMGYESLTSIAEESLAEKPIDNAVRVTKPEEFDLTAFCGAESQTVYGEDKELGFEAVFEYANFESSAKRHAAVSSSGFGLCVWFGSPEIESFLAFLLDSYGEAIMETTTMNFLQVCAEDLATSGFVQIEPAVQEEYYDGNVETELAPEEWTGYEIQGTDISSH